MPIRILSVCYLFVWWLILWSPTQAVAAGKVPDVIVSIKPIHSLVSAVMEGVGQPTLLVQGQQSPHHVRLKPSQIQSILAADLVIWMGPELESFLIKPLKTHADPEKILTLAGDRPDADDGQQAGKLHAHLTAPDRAHGWLDPEFARQAVSHIREKLEQSDPHHQSIYRENAERLRASIEALTSEITQIMAPLTDKKFIFFHDAYQGFQRQFSINAETFVLRNPHAPLGLKQAREVRQLVLGGSIDCVFSEPQFSKKLLEKIVVGSPVRVAELDPLGSRLQAGPRHYLQLMENLALSMRSCVH